MKVKPLQIVDGLLMLMFVVFALLQINDPDPVVWILIYAAMAAVSVMALRNFYPTKFLVGLMAAYVIYSAFYFPAVLQWIRTDDKAQIFDNLATMENLFIEESREFIGLMICVVVLAWYIFRSRKKAI